jgi:hypothetical protein
MRRLVAIARVLVLLLDPIAQSERYSTKILW